MKKAVVLVNVGTPDAPDVGAVRRYLQEFLSDPRVLTIPALLRWFLVHCIIVPFRAPRSAKLYQRLWSDKGSPLLYHGKMLRDKLATKVDAHVYIAMRYGNPSLSELLLKLDQKQYKQITFMPLYPQFASSTTGSALALVTEHYEKQTRIPTIKTISNFYNDIGFIKAFADRVKEYDIETYDHVLFSYHSLPLSHLKEIHGGKSCETFGCAQKVTDINRNCYQAGAYETTRLLAFELGLSSDRYSTTFQSRFAKKWLGPFTEDRLRELVSEGKRKVLVVAPSFVADCLETTIEIGEEYHDLFLSLGGESFDLVQSLNASDLWVEYLAQKVSADG